MAQSIKLKNDKYWDSSSIAKGNVNLNTYLSEINSSITKLKNISFCKMNTSFAYKTFSTEQIVEGWENYIENGDCTAWPSRNRLEIVNTSLVLLIGKTSGYGNGNVRFCIKDSDGNRVFANDLPGQILVQPSGNLYWSESLPTLLIPLDKTKKYYVTLMASGYSNGSHAEFEMNNGFGSLGTWIGAVKLM